jgi:hypothetical protein
MWQAQQLWQMYHLQYTKKVNVRCDKWKTSWKVRGKKKQFYLEMRRKNLESQIFLIHKETM